MVRLACVLICLLSVASCYTGPNTDHYEEILDDLAVPAEWQAVKTERHGPGEASSCDPTFTTLCPSVRRYFLGPDDPLTALDQVQQAMTMAGFEDQHVPLPECDGIRQTAVCSVFAQRGNERMSASVYMSADAAGLDGPAGEVVVVRVTASR